VPDEPVGPSMAAFGGNDSCPNCGARMAADQRYCLNCGHRRGEPRLPFMDAVVFMESMSAPGGAAGTPPPPPSEPKSSNRMNANAALIAGVATLVLAIGVGFLIGRAGHDNGSNAAAEAPIKVIEVGGGGGGGESTETASTAEESTETTVSSGKKNKGGKESGGGKEKSKGSAETEKNAEVGAHGASEATEEVLHTEGDVKLAEPEQEVGGSCEKGAAGCSESGEFTGNFFGE
jgi:hypothetical protein